MRRKHLKFLMILFMLTLIGSAVFLVIYDSAKQPAQDKTNLFSSRKKKDMTIRGVRFSGYHEGRKAITIKAAKFSVEKKRMGIFKFAPLRAARFRGAEIDLYMNNVPSASGPQDKKDNTIKGIFSKETIPASLLRGAASAIFEPVKINVCLDDTPLTEIRANRAKIDPLKRRIVLKGNIVATAAVNQLTTDRLMIYPEKGIIEANHKFVLKTENEQITGEKLVTNLLLIRVDGRQNF